MKTFLYLLFFAIPYVSCSQEYKFNYHTDFARILARTQDKADQLYYPKQVKKFVQRDASLTNFEVLALMIGFTADAHYVPYADVEAERAVYTLNAAGKFREAVKKGLAFNKTHPLNQMTLVELSYAYHRLNMPDSARFYGLQFTRVMDAMALSGSGFTADSALFSLTPIDGQNFIIKYLNAAIGKMASGTDSKGNVVEIIEYVAEEDGGRVPLFFNIQHAAAQQKVQLKKGAKASVGKAKDKIE